MSIMYPSIMYKCIKCLYKVDECKYEYNLFLFLYSDNNRVEQISSSQDDCQDFDTHTKGIQRY